MTLAVALSIRSAFPDRINVDVDDTTHDDNSSYNNNKKNVNNNNKERIYRLSRLSSHHHEPIKNPVELYFHDQIVNHFDDGDTRTYSQRYYQDDSFWAGPSGIGIADGGSPIFVVHGGEDAIDGTLYPFVSQHLAQRFGALTICIEHRFYGTSQPVGGKKKHHGRHHHRHHGDDSGGSGLVSNDDLKTLLQRRQALADAARLIQHVKDKMGCGENSEYYCPVMTIGGSYPGENAALMRIVHPDVVDIGYASSAPFVLSILHQVNQDAYYDKVTQVADAASPGCAMAVKTALLQIMDDSSSSLITSSPRQYLLDLANELGICLKDMPRYIQTRQMLIQEVNFIVATHFAGFNMDYYPPGSPDTDLVQACKIFQDDTLTAYDKVRKLLPLGEEEEEADDDQDDDDYDDDDDDDQHCFDLSSELPPGPGGRISAADWSGVGGDHSGYIWDFQSCVFSVEIGMSNASMVRYAIVRRASVCCSSCRQDCAFIMAGCSSTHSLTTLSYCLLSLVSPSRMDLGISDRVLSESLRLHTRD
jgi:Serine carboxypeptidase S28